MPEIMENIQHNAEMKPKIQWFLEQAQKMPKGKIRIPITDNKYSSFPGAMVLDKKGRSRGLYASGGFTGNTGTGELYYEHDDSLGFAEELKTILCLINIQEEYVKALVRIRDEYPSIYAPCERCQKKCKKNENF